MDFRVSEVLTKGSTSKRAPKACESCRMRKVRCDVTRMKAPCTNCRLDNKECIVPTSKRRHVGDRVVWSSFVGGGHNPQDPICDAIIDFGDVEKSPSEMQDVVPAISSDARHEPVFDTIDWTFNKCPIGGSPIQYEQEAAAEILLDDPAIKAEFLAPYSSPTHTISTDQYASISLPSFIGAVPEDLAPEDISYMQQRGCFTIPDSLLRDELLRCYAKWIHPFLPMLDLTHLLTAAASDISVVSPISLLIFQSVMLAASAFCNTDLGLGDRKATRRILYERCKILHDFGVERDQLCLVQSAILISFWDGDTGQIRDSYYWIGIATLQANSIGLYQDPEIGTSNRHRQRVLKRTWWSLLIRDRLLAVATRRPVQNRAFSFSVPMLQIEDFENESLLNAMQAVLAMDEASLDALETTASCCMALAQLTEYIDKTLAMQYSVRKVPGARKMHTEIVSLVPKTSGIKWEEISHFGQELQYWYGYLPEEVQRFEQPPQPLDGESSMVKVHRDLLAAYYSMTLMTLYRPLLSSITRAESERNVRKMASRIVFQAAKSITETYGVLYANDQLTCLPDTAIAALESAIVTHLLYSMSKVTGVRDTTVQRFYLCWRILLQLGDMYCLADTTIMMINVAAQRLKAQGVGSIDGRMDFGELVDETRRSSPLTSRSRFQMPLMGAIGAQKDRESTQPWRHWMQSELDDGWTDRRQKLGLGEAEHDLNCPSDGDLFDQLVCWEAVEHSFQH